MGLRAAVTVQDSAVVGTKGPPLIGLNLKNQGLVSVPNTGMRNRWAYWGVF